MSREGWIWFGIVAGVWLGSVICAHDAGVKRVWRERDLHDRLTKEKGKSI